MLTMSESKIGSKPIHVRRADARGHANYGWLDTYHTFSFNTYHDPAQMGFRTLRVMNEDRVQPGEGFGTHGHRDMEIISYVLEGELEHRDSMGNGSVLRPGEFQRISAGTGIEHSEFNPSQVAPVHFYQIWLFPAHRGLTPSYEQKSFPEAEKQGKLRLVASQDGKDGSLLIHQDVRVFLSTLDANQEVRYKLTARRHAWLQVLRGKIDFNGQTLATSDGAAVSDEMELTVLAKETSEVMLFDLA
jgi:redox-sensitive bicupin YhaK (pirin superfamily)